MPTFAAAYRTNQKPVIGPLTLDIKNPLTNGLIFALPMTEYNSLNISDYSRSRVGKSTNIGGGPTWSSGQVGPQLTFNGTSQALDFGFAPAMQVATNISVVSWVLNSAGSTGASIISWNMPTTAGGYEFRIAGTTANCMELLQANIASLAVDSVAVPTTGLIPIAVTYDGATVSFYQSGKLTSSFSASGGFVYGSDNSLRVGSQTGNEWFHGSMSALYVWNRALTAGEIYNVTQRPYSIWYPRLIQRWPGISTGIFPLPGNRSRQPWNRTLLAR